MTDRPGRSVSTTVWFGSKLIRIGTRWTILVKLPVPGSNGSREKLEPGAKLSTAPHPAAALHSLQISWRRIAPLCRCPSSLAQRPTGSRLQPPMK